MRPFYPANLGQGHFSTASGETRARVVLTCTSGALQHKLHNELCDCGLRPTADYGSHRRFMTINTTHWWSDKTPWGWWWCSQL